MQGRVTAPLKRELGAKMTLDMPEASGLDDGERFTRWREWGSGATATVYRVRDEQLGDDVAIKILDRARMRDPNRVQSMRESMRNEVRISRSLYQPSQFETRLRIGVLFMDVILSTD